MSDSPEKLPAVLGAMRLDGYDAVGTGALDAAQGEVYAAAARREAIRLVRALPRPDALGALAGRLRVKRLKDHSFGVTSLPPPPPGVAWAAYLADAVRAVGTMRGECDFLVLLSQLGLERDRELALRCGEAGPHVIIGNLDAQELREPLRVGGSMLLPAGQGGRTAGIAEVLFPAGGTPRLGRVSLVPARGEGPADPRVLGLVSGHYSEERRRFFKTFDTGLLAASKAEGAGDVQRCGRCHAMEAASWKPTRHARAVDTLIKRGRLVPECTLCHSTRYRDKGVFDHAARAGDVDCTGCHPVAARGEESRCPQKATATQGERTCLPCHTEENSPGFRYEEYLPRVVHGAGGR